MFSKRNHAEDQRKMDKLFLFILLSMSVWRVSSMFAREYGPLEIFNRIRIFALGLGQHSAIFRSLYDGINCMWCNSVWFSAIASFAIAENMIQWVIYTLSISCMAILIEERVYGKE